MQRTLNHTHSHLTDLLFDEITRVTDEEASTVQKFESTFLLMKILAPAMAALQ
jgi:hypothetical protein